MEPVVVTMIALSAVISFALGWVLTRFVRIRWGGKLVAALALVAVALIPAGQGRAGQAGLGWSGLM